MKKMLTAKTLVMFIILVISSLLNAIPENTLVSYPMQFPMKANPDASVIVGQAGGGSAVLVWTEEDGVVNLGEGDAYDISGNNIIAGEKTIRDENGALIRRTAGFWDMNQNFTEIGNFPGQNPTGDGNFSTAYAISENGTILAGMGWLGGRTSAFKWTADGGIIDLRPEATTSSRVNALSGDGSLAVGWITGQWGRLPVYWDADNVMHEIPNDGSGEAMGVSPSGQYFTGSAGGQAFLNIGEETFYFGQTGFGWNNIPNHVNNNGLVVGAVRNIFMMLWEGFVYNQTMGMVNANEYFTARGVEIPEGMEIQAVSWVSEDSKTFIGWTISNAGRQGFIIKLSDSAIVNGQISAPDAEDLTLASITNGIVVTSPDAEGNYTILLEPGSHTLTVSMPGYYTQTSAEFTVETGEVINDMDFDLVPINNLATVSGNITLVEGTGNVRQVLIQAGNFTANPDYDGNYELFVEAGTYNITASLFGFFDFSQEITLTTGQNLEIDITMIGINATNTLTFNINGTEEIDHSQTRIYLNHNSAGNRYFKPNAQGILQLEMTYQENISASVISAGYKPVFIDNITTIPLENLEIEVNLEKTYHEPRDIYGHSNGLISWKAPYAVDSYVDNFEDYNVNDPISLKNPMWTPFTTWPAGFADAIITDEQSQDGFKSLKITAETDVIVDLRGLLINNPNLNSGQYEINFDILIPEGYTGHYNLIRSLSPLEFSLEVFFRTDGMLKIQHNNQTITDLTFNHNEWMTVSHIIDLDNDTASMYIDDVEIVTWQFTANAYFEGNGLLNLELIDFSGESDPAVNDIGLFYIDNFAFSKINGLGPDSYSVYFDSFASPFATNVQELEYLLTGIEPGTYEFGVSAMYNTTESSINGSFITIEQDDLLLPPRNLTAQVINRNVSLNWEAPGIESGWFTHSLSDELGNGVGTNSATTFTVAQRFTPAQLIEFGVAGAHLTKISFVPNFANAEYTIKVWTGGTGSPLAPGTLIAEQNVTDFTAEAWNEVVLNTALNIPFDTELWIGIYINTTGGFPAGCDSGPQYENFGNIMHFNNAWTTLTALAPTLAYNWHIKGFADAPSNSVSFSANHNAPITESTISNAIQQNVVWRNQYKESIRINRDFIGYNVYRGNSLITSQPINTMSLVDENVEYGNYVYHVTAVYDSGESVPAIVNVTVDTSSDNDQAVTPFVTELNGNYPNPFNPETVIKFSLAENQHISIEIFNVKGQKVKTLLNENMDKGQHQIVWNGRDENGRQAGSGMFFYRMKSGKYTNTKKMILMK